MAPIRTVASVLLLLLFLAAQWQQWAQHHLHHSHEHATQHTEADENDACHRSIFHHDADHGCAHPAHITSAHTHCELCDYLCIPVLYWDAPFALIRRSVHYTVVFAVHHFVPSATWHRPDARGPPIA